MNSVNKSECIFSIPDLNSLTERTVDENAATTDRPEKVHDAKVRNLYALFVFLIRRGSWRKNKGVGTGH